MVAMEEHKRRALLHFLKRSSKPLHAYVDALAPVAQDLMDAYDQLSPEWHDTDKFLQVMIIDGCFILEILRAATTTSASVPHPNQPPPPPSVPHQQQSQPQHDHPSLVKNYAANDPIFSDHGRLYIDSPSPPPSSSSPSLQTIYSVLAYVSPPS